MEMVKILYSNKMADIENKINELNEYREFSNYIVLISGSYHIYDICRLYKGYEMSLKDLKIIPLTNSNDLRYFAIMEGKKTQNYEKVNYEKYEIIGDDETNSISKIIIEENGKEIIIDNKEIIFEWRS